MPGKINSKSIILLEFNEICPPLLNTWIIEGKLPNFEIFFENSQIFTAMADTTDASLLEPWIQWYSMHTGLAYHQHKVKNLTDGPSAGHADIWHMLLNNGNSVGCCASMNTAGFTASGSFYLPDPWCTSQAPYPVDMEIFHRIVTKLVQENSNRGDGDLKTIDYVKWISFLISHGLRSHTISGIVNELLLELLNKESNIWKRATVLDKIQFDVFRYYWKTCRPDFSTFFINSTAHYQHAYWHYAFPEQFNPVPDPIEKARFENAILFGYMEMDRLLAQFFKFEKEGVILVLASGLSQHANNSPQTHFYRPLEVRTLLADLDIRPLQLLPVMAEQYSAHFASNEEKEAAKAMLSTLRVNDRQLFEFPDAPEHHLFFGCGVKNMIDTDAIISNWPNGGKKPFYDTFCCLPHTKSGAHHPESVLWFKTSKHRVISETVSILDILPTIMEHFGVDRKYYDRNGELTGNSILPLLNGIC